MVYCQQCGAQNIEGAQYCAECGSPLKTPINGLESKKIKDNVRNLGYFLIGWGIFISILTGNIGWGFINIILGGMLVLTRHHALYLVIGIILALVSIIQIAYGVYITGIINILVAAYFIYYYQKYDKILEGYNEKLNPTIPIIGSILTIIIIVIVIGGSFGNLNFDSPSEYLNPVSGAELQSYNSSSSDFNLLQVIKNPDNYKGQKFRTKGEIAWIVENYDGTSDMAIILPDSSNYRENVYITYKGKTAHVKGDTITVIGECSGSYTYTSDDNEQITLPCIKAVYIS